MSGKTFDDLEAQRQLFLDEHKKTSIFVAKVAVNSGSASLRFKAKMLYFYKAFFKRVGFKK